MFFSSVSKPETGANWLKREKESEKSIPITDNAKITLQLQQCKVNHIKAE
jgi:hypothetical protein